jgi:hypothetical protein
MSEDVIKNLQLALEHLEDARRNAWRIERLIPDPEPYIVSICEGINKMLREVDLYFPPHLTEEERRMKEVNEKAWEIVGSLISAKRLIEEVIHSMRWEMKRQVM